MPRTPEHDAYRSARSRCQNKAHADFANYGQRGIEFRFESFEQFFQTVGPRPSKKHSLDRFPNNNGHYEPGNVRWATMKQQSMNRRTNRWIAFQGKLRTVTQWATRLGLKRDTLFKRLEYRWCEPCVVSVPRRGIPCPHR